MILGVLKEYSEQWADCCQLPDYVRLARLRSRISPQASSVVAVWSCCCRSVLLLWLQ